METHDEPTSPPDAARSAQERRDGKIRRIAADMQALVEDLRTWIDLRLDLAVLEVEERLDRLRNEIALGLVLAIFGFFAVLFTLTTLALGVGWLLGRPFWGFLAVSVTLILVVVVLRAVKPELVPPSNLFETIRGERTEQGTDEPVGSDEQRSTRKEETSETRAT